MPAQRCKWARASALVTDDHIAELRSNGLVVIDGALSPAEVRAARIELADLDRCGQLAEVACQSKARVRNDRIGWVSQESAASLPALGVAMRLLRALPAEVESRAAAAAAAAGEDACYWRMAVPTLCMAAVYDGSKSKVSRGQLKERFGGSAFRNATTLANAVPLVLCNSALSPPLAKHPHTR